MKTEELREMIGIINTVKNDCLDGRDPDGWAASGNSGGSLVGGFQAMANQLEMVRIWLESQTDLEKKRDGVGIGITGAPPVSGIIPLPEGALYETADSETSPTGMPREYAIENGLCMYCGAPAGLTEEYFKTAKCRECRNTEGAPA